MSKIRIKITRANYPAFNEIRKSAGVTNLCQEVATRLYGSVSGVKGYEMEQRSYPDRNGVSIFADDYPAIQDNFDNNTLVKLVR